MMGGNPNWWSMQPSQFVYASNSSVSSDQSDHHFPVRSWSQLLMGGNSSAEEENRFGSSHFEQQKNWEEQVLNLNSATFTRDSVVDHVKQEVSSQPAFSGHLESYDNQFQLNDSWLMPVSSPTSCVTNLSNSLLNFTCAKQGKNQRYDPERSSECNSTGTGGVSKKARVQHSSSQPAFKVRKEKTMDKIAAIHQLVCPFGKTDTASVLSEAICYIRFLQAQIEALSSPYMRNVSRNASQPSVQDRNCLFHQEPAQDLQGIVVNKDLRSRGLCLVPVSCTQHVGTDNGADYWAPPALSGGGF